MTAHAVEPVDGGYVLHSTPTTDPLSTNQCPPDKFYRIPSPLRSMCTYKSPPPGSTIHHVWDRDTPSRWSHSAFTFPHHPHHHRPNHSLGEAGRLRSFSRGKIVLAVGCLYCRLQSAPLSSFCAPVLKFTTSPQEWNIRIRNCILLELMESVCQCQGSS